MIIIDKQYVEFNGMMYPTIWFTDIIKLEDLEYTIYSELYDWAAENKIPFIFDKDKEEIHLMPADAMAFKLQWL